MEPIELTVEYAKRRGNYELATNLLEEKNRKLESEKRLLEKERYTYRLSVVCWIGAFLIVSLIMIGGQL